MPKIRVEGVVYEIGETCRVCSRNNLDWYGVQVCQLLKDDVGNIEVRLKKCLAAEVKEGDGHAED